MQFTEFYATGTARRHMLDKHRVHWSEVEEVLSGPVRGLRAADVRGERRYMISGRTTGGRRLRIVVALESVDRIRVVTAYEIRK